ncbi:hypothetical protein L3Q82_005933 [Scortum barcoo]|uniref:Uncharacterized protein n=1 Tax=Scortum barcoo TaxID=214431 RepID=A0ACB8X1I2_9TELE|nr:hypothetical protein L3Q82_005933 [Scortum barcoo]
MKHWLRNILIVTLWLECKGEDKVIQPTGDVIATEGQTVTLPCTFQTTRGSPALFWYKQEVNDFPKYVLRHDKAGTANAPEFPEERFISSINKTSVPLKIQKLQLSDSAVYYCALQPYSDRKQQNSVQKPLEQRQQNTPQRPLEGVSAVKISLQLRKKSSVQKAALLLCPTRYSKKATGSDQFYWYRQYPGKPPEFLIFHLGTRNTEKPGLSVKVSEDKTQMDLQISSAAVTDSAVYYCAVRPTVTGNSKTLYKNLWSKDNRILHNVH